MGASWVPDDGHSRPKIPAFFRVIRYVHDVEALSPFYRETFGFSAREHVIGEWVVFTAAGWELGPHRVGPAYRGSGQSSMRNVESNVKLVFLVDRELDELRRELIARLLVPGETQRYAGQPGPHFDCRDAEGNVFQVRRPDAT